MIVVIGAGSSGLPALKALRARGLDAVALEVGSGIGGNWRYGNDNGMSSAYRSLHINTNRDAMAYADFPMPPGTPVYPGHREILAYFEAYAGHFALREAIRFRTRAVRVEPLGTPPGAGGFRVETRHEDTGAAETLHAEAVVVANGHHWSPRRPAWPGAFDGDVLHAHDYRTPDVLAGRRVLVVGAGNSAVDIAVEATRVAARVALSTRRGAHVVPKYVFGRPTDALLRPAFTRLPFGVQRTLFGALLRLARGRQEAYGFPTPPYPFGSEHPTISSGLLDEVGHGRIAVRPDVARLDGDAVVFADGTREPFDLVVTATGYDIRFPFLDAAVLDPSDNRVGLYKHVAHPGVPGLFFVGLVQPLGAIMPLAELQSEWVAELVAGESALPPPEAMRADVERAQRRMASRYHRSPRHTIQVDVHPYRREIARARRDGRRRAARQAA